jgi:hypothetical protein
MWRQWANFILGLLVVIFAYIGGGHTWRFVIAGLLIAILALWSTLKKKPQPTP